MEPPPSTLVFVVFGFVISGCAFGISDVEASASAVHPPPPPPPQSPPPPSPPRSSSSMPPTPTPPSQSPPPPRSSPEKLNSESHRSPPHRRPENRNASNKRHPPPHPAEKHSKINTGKKIGLLFAGIIAILQIGVVGFLVFKRRQLLKGKNRYETCS